MKKPNLVLRNVRTNNLNIPHIEIPLRQVILVTGVSGSGKSSLVFDTIFAEAFLNYGQILSKTLGIQFSPVKTPLLEYFENLPLAIALEQRVPGEILKLSVGEFSGITNLLIGLFVTQGELICPDCRIPVIRWTPHRIAEEIFRLYPKGTRFYVTAPMGSVPHAQILTTVDELARDGFIRYIVDNKIVTLDDIEKIGWRKEHDFSVVVDRFVIEDGTKDRLVDSCSVAFNKSSKPFVLNKKSKPLELKTVEFVFPDGEKISFSDQPICYKCGKLYKSISVDLFDTSYPEGRCHNCKGSGCEKCHDTGRNPIIFNIFLKGYTFPELLSLPIGELANWIETFDSSLKNGVLRPYIEWLKTSRDFHIDYLSLNRALSTLSAGELQKLRLIEFWKNPPVGILSIFDEPLKFLDAEERVIFSKKIRDLTGLLQTVIIVDHHPDSLKFADFVIELGPGSGKEGGKVVWSGPADEYEKRRPGKDLNLIGRKRSKKSVTKTDERIHLIGARGNNLKDISVSFPLRTLVYVTGPVGSGKTTLVFETLVPALRLLFLKKTASPRPYRELQCPVNIGSVMTVRERMTIIKPSEKSIVATFLNVFTPIRQFYAQLSESRKRGFHSRHFSYTTPEGACPECGGKGTVFSREVAISTVETTCPYCSGKRYREEILSVRYRGYSIADILDMSLEKALKIFNFIHSVKTSLEMAQTLNLSHILLGQSLITLSGGELHRIWMVRRLASSQSPGGHEILCFDHPTAGLHLNDVDNLLEFWDRLVASDKTVIVCDNYDLIEHFSDWVIKLGHGSGPKGGFLVYEGPPKN